MNNIIIKSKLNKNVLTYTIYTKNFKTISECKSLVKDIKNNIAGVYGYERSKIRIPNGLITLQGCHAGSDQYINLCNVIGDFSKYLKNNDYSNFRLVTNFSKKIN